MHLRYEFSNCVSVMLWYYIFRETVVITLGRKLNK